MKITRRTNISVTTERRLVVRQPETVIGCPSCVAPMIPAHIFAEFFGISSRTIYRLIESDAIHYTETETNEIYVCQISVERALEKTTEKPIVQPEQNQSKTKK